MMHDRCNCYFSFWAIFCHFTPVTARKMKISKKWKIASRYYHFTQVYLKTWSHAILFLRYGMWWMSLFFFILGNFLPFYPLYNPKNKNFTKIKKTVEISSFYTSVPKIMILFYTVPEIWCVTDVIAIFYFGIFFALYPPPPPFPKLPKKSKFLKNEKKAWRYYNFTLVYRKLWLDNVRLLRYGVQRMDERTDGRTNGESDI